MVAQKPMRNTANTVACDNKPTTARIRSGLEGGTYPSSEDGREKKRERHAA